MEDKTIEFEWADIDSIRPYDNNPRRNDQGVEALANSIKQFGWNTPIVVDADGVILAGHTSYKAAKLLGLDKVPVRRSNLTGDEAKAYRIADNKTADLTGWDEEKLHDELASIVDIDMKIFGFEDDIPDLPDDDVGEFDDCGAVPDIAPDVAPITNRRIIITYKTEEEESYIKTLFGIVGKLKNSYHFSELKPSIDKQDAKEESKE